MVMKYKSAAFHINPAEGMNEQNISKLDEWLNIWLTRHYIVEKVSEITVNGSCGGFLFIFKIEK